jgi:hypothetical protein
VLRKLFGTTKGNLTGGWRIYSNFSQSVFKSSLDSIYDNVRRIVNFTAYLRGHIILKLVLSI